MLKVKSHAAMHKVTGVSYTPVMVRVSHTCTYPKLKYHIQCHSSEWLPSKSLWQLVLTNVNLSAPTRCSDQPHCQVLIDNDIHDSSCASASYNCTYAYIL